MLGPLARSHPPAQCHQPRTSRRRLVWPAGRVRHAWL